MDKIEKIRQEIERLREDYLNRSYTFVPVAMEQMLEFIDTLSEEPDKVLEGEVILNGHGLLVDVTKWDNGYKLKVIIKED